VRGLAEKGDPMCQEIFRVQAHALGIFFDEMINTFDPDALVVGGGAIETSEDFQQWFVAEIHAGMPPQREEQADIPIYIMPNGDTAGARGAAIEALQFARQMTGCFKTAAGPWVARPRRATRLSRINDARRLPPLLRRGDRAGCQPGIPALVEAFARVPREKFLGPPPWQLVRLN
jgi:hypothetical protein